MTRRDFFRRTGAAIAALFVSSGIASQIKGFVPRPITPTFDGNYVAFVHPSTWADFVSIHRRGQWKDAHSAWRKAGKPGGADPQSIWARYGKTFPPTDLAGHGEMGRFEGVRFIESRGVL